MNDKELVMKSYQALQRARSEPPTDQLRRLMDAGVIDDQGQVREDVRLWHAFLAVVAVKPGGDATRIDCFRCLKPAFGSPGSAQLDIRRESLAQYLAENKRVITAYWNDEQQRWNEGEEVRLTTRGYLRTDGNEEESDDLGELPTFSFLRSEW